MLGFIVLLSLPPSAAAITAFFVACFFLLLFYMTFWRKVEAYFSYTPWLRHADGAGGAKMLWGQSASAHTVAPGSNIPVHSVVLFVDRPMVGSAKIALRGCE